MDVGGAGAGFGVRGGINLLRWKRKVCGGRQL